MWSKSRGLLGRLMLVSLDEGLVRTLVLQTVLTLCYHTPASLRLGSNKENVQSNVSQCLSVCVHMNVDLCHLN